MLLQKLVDHVVQQQAEVAKVSIQMNSISLDKLSFHVHFLNLASDTSAYVEYSSSSDEGEKSVTRAKPVKRRRDDSDSGSDVSILPTISSLYTIVIAKLNNFVCFRRPLLAMKNNQNAFFFISTIHRDRVIRMLAKRLDDFQAAGVRKVVDAVHAVVDLLRKKKNLRRHPMKISAMSRNERKRHQHASVAEVHAVAVANQKNPKNPKWVKMMKKRDCLSPKATKARFVPFQMYFIANQVSNRVIELILTGDWMKQGSPKRKAPAKNSANNKSTPQRSKRAAVPTKPLKDESSGENESEDDEPLSKKAKPLPPTVNIWIKCSLWFRVTQLKIHMIIKFRMMKSRKSSRKFWKKRT